MVCLDHTSWLLKIQNIWFLKIRCSTPWSFGLPFFPVEYSFLGLDFEKERNNDHDQDPLPKDLLHIWSQSSESSLLRRRSTATITKISSRKICYTDGHGHLKIHLQMPSQNYETYHQLPRKYRSIQIAYKQRLFPGRINFTYSYRIALQEEFISITETDL